MFGMAAGALATLRLGTANATEAMHATSKALVGGSASIASLKTALAAAPRRRQFTRVPFMVYSPDDWDHEAAALLLSYGGMPKQAWENSDLGAAWPGLMREALNGQVFAHHHPEFLEVAAMHGAAHLAMFNQAMWDKYGLASRSGGAATKNSFVIEKSGISPSDDHEDLQGFYGPNNNNIVTLQRRGMVFVACHDSIHAFSRALAPTHGGDPDVIAADLTNHLIPDAVLVPSVVAFLAELQKAGYSYAKGA
jgi:intracellular sulfur oxidation DsrE/DsrF family protein